jgi:hypothetical protein
MRDNLELVSVVVTTVRTYRVKPLAPGLPTKPQITGFKFIQRSTAMASQMYVEVLLSDVIAADHVTSRMVNLSTNGNPKPPIDAASMAPIFPCIDGDALVATVTDTNAAGSVTSDEYSGTASLPDVLPTKPAVTGFLYSPGGTQGGDVIDPRKGRR